MTALIEKKIAKLNKPAFQYNPIITKGTFELNGKTVKAVDIANAKYKFAMKIGLVYGSPECSDFFQNNTLTIIEAPTRLSDYVN